MLTIRQARFSELAGIARAYTLAFWDDVLFGKLIHPHRQQFPADNDLYWLRRMQVNWWDYTNRLVVSTTIDPEGKEVVTGAAQWARLGPGRSKMECWWFDPRNLVKPIMATYARLASLVYPNRAADPGKEDVLERSEPFLDQVWTGPRAESWYLESLAVHPDHQSQGHGRALVKWGLDQAERDGVCASVISADGKEQFYQRCGFNVQDGWGGMGKGNPLADVPGGLIFFRETNT